MHELMAGNAEPFLYFLRLLSRKRRLNQNSLIDFLLKISVLQLISVLQNS